MYIRVYSLCMHISSHIYTEYMIECKKNKRLEAGAQVHEVLNRKPQEGDSGGTSIQVGRGKQMRNLVVG